MKKRAVEIIQLPQIPPDITVAVRQPAYTGAAEEPDNNFRTMRDRERAGGRALIRELAVMKLGDDGLKIVAGENEKPQAFYRGEKIYISIAHCRRLVCGAVSGKRELGIDLEHVDRKTHPGLKSRITHPDETEITDVMNALQLWTLKESAVKWSGSGLRTALNRIKITGREDPVYHLLLPDGRELHSCSIIQYRHWISVTYG